jgi:hypothetical protein
MRRPSRLLPLLLLALLAPAAACVPTVTEEERACPCAEGWTCCAGVCVKGGASACRVQPDVTPPPAPVLDASRTPSPTREERAAVHGRTEPSARVLLYGYWKCQGLPLAEAVADAEGAFTAWVPLAPNAAVDYSAEAWDAAGNTGPCSATLTLVHDGVAPRAPELFGLAPASPSPSLQPVVLGRAEPGARVVLFADAACEQALPFEGTADAAGALQVWTRVTAESTATFFARAEDRAGNTSPCSRTSLGYTHDATPPAPPVLTRLPPPRGVGLPYVLWEGTSEPLARVLVHASADCSDLPVRQVQASWAGEWAAELAVTPNGTTRRHAVAVDAAGNRSACAELGTYVHDDLPPATPVYTLTPASPQNSTATPRVLLATDPGATVIVRGFAPGDRREVELARGEAGPTGSVELTLAPLSPGLWTLWAVAEDAVGNVSPGAYAPYHYDVAPPAAPELQLLSEPSPSASATALWAVGRAEREARVSVHADAACAGPPLGEAEAVTTRSDAPARAVVPVALPQDAEVRLYARATDRAGNASACSAEGLPFRRAAQGERAWGDVEPLPPAQETRLALDAGGALLRAVSRHSAGWQHVEVQRRPSGGGAWQLLRTLGSWQWHEGGGLGPAELQANARGDLLVSWLQPVPGADVRRHVARYTASTGTWEEPTTPPLLSFELPFHLAADGSAVGCYVGAGGVRECVRARAGGAWEEVPASPSADPSITPESQPLGVHALPGGGAVWLRLHRTLATYGRGTVYGALLSAETGEWGPEVALAQGVSGARVAVDAGGAAWLATVESGALRVRRLAPGATDWGGPVQLAAEPAPGGAPLLAVGGAAGELAAGVFNPGHVQLLRHAPATGWGAPSEVFAPTELSRVVLEPTLLLGAPGEAWLLWRTTAAPSIETESALRATRYVSGEGWEAPQTLGYTPGVQAPAPGDVLSHPTGVLLVRFTGGPTGPAVRELR